MTWNIIGHKKNIKFFENILKSGELSGTYLFYGEEGLGKKTLALELIKNITELSQKEITKNPDIITLFPSENISIENIRELKIRLNLSSLHLKQKICLIDNIHLLTTQAANAFLKTLEEPKGKNPLIILIASDLTNIPKTIISRCQIINFYKVSQDDIREYLKTKLEKEDKIEKIVEFSCGNTGLAVKSIENPALYQEFQKIVSSFHSLKISPFWQRFKLLEGISEEKLSFTLTTWIRTIRKEIITNISQKGYSEKIDNLVLSLKKMILYKSLLKNKINKKLLIDNLVFSL